jgi:hypothetical protein
MWGSQTGLFAAAILGALALSVGIVPGSSAQEITPTGEYKEGFAVGSWLVYPKAFVGAVWDSNVNQNTNQPVVENQPDSGVTVRFVPDIRAVYDGGIHRSTVYGVADARFFNSDTISCKQRSS